MIKIKQEEKDKDLKSIITSHFGPNPKKGGNPPNERKAIKRVEYWRFDKFVILWGIILIFEFLKRITRKINKIE